MKKKPDLERLLAEGFVDIINGTNPKVVVTKMAKEAKMTPEALMAMLVEEGVAIKADSKGKKFTDRAGKENSQDQQRSH